MCAQTPPPREGLVTVKCFLPLFATIIILLYNYSHYVNWRICKQIMAWAPMQLICGYFVKFQTKSKCLCLYCSLYLPSSGALFASPCISIAGVMLLFTLRSCLSDFLAINSVSRTALCVLFAPQLHPPPCGVSRNVVNTTTNGPLEDDMSSSLATRSCSV